MKLPGRKPLQHLITLKNKDSSGEKARASWVENMARHIVAVRPNTDFWIIDKVRRVGDKVVEIVRAQGIARSGNGDTLMREIRTGANHELRENPASTENIVRNHWVAVIMRGTRAAERLKKRVAGDRSVKARAAFVPDRKAGVVPLNILYRTDAAIRVRRIASRNKTGDAGSDTLKTDSSRVWRRKHSSLKGLGRTINSLQISRRLRANRLPLNPSRCQQRRDRRHRA